MTSRSAALGSRVVGAITSSPSPVPLLTGGCGTGRTAILLHVHQALGAGRCQYVNVERAATTPERFLRALVSDSPFRAAAHIAPAAVTGPREAFDASLAFLSSACTTEGAAATFLLDEVLDLRTFESFPGLRTVMADLVAALETSPNRFVLATRFGHRAARLVSLGHGRLVLQSIPQMTVAEVREALARTPHPLGPATSDDDLARTVHALTEGRPCYVRTLLEAMSWMSDGAGADPVGALVALLGPDGALAHLCRFSYELRLHRARGYGALKAILEVLTEEEPLTLTAISQRLGRTPGSTKDYLGWLEDVDLVVVERKRYRFADPLLRLWVRLQARSGPPSGDTIVREVQRYVMARLAAGGRAEVPVAASPGPAEETVGVAGAAPSGTASRPRTSGIVELD